MKTYLGLFNELSKMNILKKFIEFVLFPFIGGLILSILFPEIHIVKIIIIVVGLELLIEFKVKSPKSGNAPAHAGYAQASYDPAARSQSNPAAA